MLLIWSNNVEICDEGDYKLSLETSGVIRIFLAFCQFGDVVVNGEFFININSK